MRPLRLVVSAAALLAVLVLGATSAAAPASRTFAYVSVSQIMVGWDPASGYSNEILAMSNMYETLTRYDSRTKKAHPLLARSFRSGKGGKEWTFTLRKGVTFHTGRPLDAQAAKAAIMRTITLKQGAAYLWDSVRRIDTPDRFTLVFRLKYAAPLDLNAAADYAAYIYDVKAAGAADLAKWFAEGHDAGTGPYTVESWQRGQEVELRQKAYPGYWRGWSGAHYDRVEYWVVPSVTTQAQLIRAGKVTFVARMTPQLWASFKNDRLARTTSAPSWQNLWAMLNTKTGPLADERVRKAVAYGIDYNGILAALRGSAVRQVGVVPPGLWGHSPRLPRYVHSPKIARSLLEQAGFGPGGERISLELTHVQGDADEQLVATLIKSQLAALNIDVRVRAMQWPVQWDKAKSSNTKNRQDILVFYWWPDYPDPYSWFVNLFKTEEKPFFNLAYYSNPKLDRMIGQAEPLAASNRPRAIRLYEQMQRTLHADAPAIPLYVQRYQRVLLKSVRNFVENPAYPNVTFVYELRPGA